MDDRGEYEARELAAMRHDELLKSNLLGLVAEHRAIPHDGPCLIMLTLVLEVAQRANLHFTDEEKSLFL